MKKQQFIAAFIIFALLFTSIPNISKAEFSAGYIISDVEFSDSTSMTQYEIQKFLERKKSFLATYLLMNPETGFKTSAAEIIFNASTKYNINPKVLLTLLQKEQSLIEKSHPSQYNLDWATGYAICDSCSVDTPGVSQYKGFLNQVFSAARQLRNYIENPYNYNFREQNTYTIDGEIVNIFNESTAALYNYTPHLHGNLNFWRIWQRWFIKKFPNGSLVKLENNPTVWVIDYGAKRPIKSMSVLLSKYDPKNIITVSPLDLDQYEDSPMIKFHEFSILQDPAGVNYILINDTVRPIESENVFRKLGYFQEEIITISWQDVNNYIIGEPITMTSIYPTGALLQDKNTGGIYYVLDGKRYPLYARELIASNYNNIAILPAETEEINAYTLESPILFKDGSLIKAENSSTIYIIDEGTRRPILSGKIFLELGYNWDNIYETSSQMVNLHDLGEPIDNKFLNSYNLSIVKEVSN